MISSGILPFRVLLAQVRITFEFHSRYGEQIVSVREYTLEYEFPQNIVIFVVQPFLGYTPTLEVAEPVPFTCQLHCPLVHDTLEDFFLAARFQPFGSTVQFRHICGWPLPYLIDHVHRLVLHAGLIVAFSQHK